MEASGLAQYSVQGIQGAWARRGTHTVAAMQQLGDTGGIAEDRNTPVAAYLQVLEVAPFLDARKTLAGEEDSLVETLHAAVVAACTRRWTASYQRARPVTAPCHHARSAVTWLLMKLNVPRANACCLLCMVLPIAQALYLSRWFQREFQQSPVAL